MTRNLRFWAAINGSQVKITLHNNQQLHWSAGQQTDEGWEREASSWQHTGLGVERIGFSEGRDCDGYSSYYAKLFAPAGRLTANEYQGVCYPDWVRVESEVNDANARAAGY